MMTIGLVTQVLIGVLFLGLAVGAVLTGRIKLKSHMCYREREPRTFWLAVSILGLIGSISVATAGCQPVILRG